MGRDIEAIKITGEDRRRYRDKVRRSLDAFARMLRERLFDDNPSMVGQEIELNLADERGMPSMRNTDVLEAIADPAWATEVGQFNLEINVPPRQLGGDAFDGLEREVRADLNAARQGPHGRQPPGHDRHPAHAGRARRGREHHVDQRALPGAERADLRRPRGRHAHRDRRRRAAAHPRRQHHARGRLHQRAAARPGQPGRLREATGTPPRPSRARRSRSAPTRRSCSASSCGTRPGSRCSSRPPTPGRTS